MLHLRKLRFGYMPSQRRFECRGECAPVEGLDHVAERIRFRHMLQRRRIGIGREEDDRNAKLHAEATCH